MLLIRFFVGAGDRNTVHLCTLFSWYGVGRAFCLLVLLSSASVAVSVVWREYLSLLHWLLRLYLITLRNKNKKRSNICSLFILLVACPSDSHRKGNGKEMDKVHFRVRVPRPLDVGAVLYWVRRELYATCVL